MDISTELRNQDYANVSAGNWFYVWISRTSGLYGEMSFATSTTNYSPSLIPTELDAWKYLVNSLSWNSDGVSIITTVNGADSGAIEGGNFGNGNGGLASGYDMPDSGMYNLVGVPGLPVLPDNKEWTQEGGITNDGGSPGNSNPYGGSWPSLDIGEAKRYKVLLRTDGGFDFTEELAICYHGDSKVKVLNKQTGQEEEKKAKDIADTDFVYSATRNKFVPVVFNSVTKRNTKYMLLKKGLLGENKPSEDFYITKGHPILYDGKETPVEKIPGAEEVSCEEQEVYSMVTDMREYIIVNGVETMTWSYHGWRNAFLNGSHTISWTNGTKQHNLDKIDVEMVGDENMEPKNVKVCKNAFGKNIPKEDINVNENYELIIDEMTTKTKIKEMINGVTVKFLDC